jgi:hypothetical protein
MYRRRTLSDRICTALSVAVVAVGLFGVVHFHPPQSSAAAVAEATGHSACDCHHHPVAPGEAPTPADSDDCHFCKLLTHLSADGVGCFEFRVSSPLCETRLDLDVRRPRLLATTCCARGPPACQVNSC